MLRDGRTVGTGLTSEFRTEQIVELMVGRNVDQLYPRSRRITGDVMLQVTELQGQRLPRAATLELRRGEVLGIAGLIGSGRTELLRTIFGLDPVRSGQVQVAAGRGSRPADRWRGGVGIVSEDRKSEGLALNLSIADNITLPCLTGLGPGNLVLPARQSQATRPWLQSLAIKCRDASQRVGDLSGGNQQKVALGRLLHADVDVLLLDEPTRGIDVGSKAQIYRLIDQLVAADRPRGDAAKAVLIVSSYLPELMGVCDRIAVMTRGRLQPAQATRDRTEHDIMLEAIGKGVES